MSPTASHRKGDRPHITARATPTGLAAAGGAMVLALAAGCVSSERRYVEAEARQWMQEALDYQRAEVAAEVETRFKRGDLRFKVWVRSIADADALPFGISTQEAAALREAGLIQTDILYASDLQPFVIGQSGAWEYRTTLLFDYMRRYNRALFEKLVREDRVPAPANPAPAS